MSKQDFGRGFWRTGNGIVTGKRRRLSIDAMLCIAVLAVIVYGLFVLYSAVEQDSELLLGQVVRLGLGFVLMLAAAQLRPAFYLRSAPVLYVFGIALLGAVLLIGVEVNGSRRWLDVPGLVRFQPSEFMKIAVPLMVAWHFNNRALPPRLKDLLIAGGIIAAPAACIVVQPDLGTGLLVVAGGLATLLLAGLSWRWVLCGFAAAAAIAPVLWHELQDYQRRRILTLFDPEQDPLGAGWNIIQSTTALGSGGLFGKGLHNGTQSQLNFLPESQTDFIMAVIGEELGFAGVVGLLVLYMVIVARGLIIAQQSAQPFGQLIAGSLSLVFFVYFFVNIAMVAGLLPVVGVPLPLVSYGGTSAITLLLGFGIIISVRNQKSW